ncbi:MAG TPA: hypothetical protein DDZ67_10680 [Xanthomonadaceae bacterium]|nr:hypothetical protein [Xanthomonadaceae bacterium]
MGGALRVPAGTEVEFELDVAAPPGSRVEPLLDGHPLETLDDPMLAQARARKTWSWRSDGHRHWLRVDVRATDGRLLLLGNPVYLNF